MDRNQLEQDAIRQQNLGNLEGALRSYAQIVRLDPRDRRIRQKVAELYLKLGRTAEAEKQLREVAEGLVREGSHRAAVAVFKQLVALKPDDPALQFELGECYVASSYGNDARTHFDTAMRLWIGLGRAADAARAARRVADLSPGEPVLRLKVAELLEASGNPQGAAAVYQEVAEEYRRRGRPDEVGRIAEMALRLRPDDAALLLDAAAARVEAGEHKRALVHLQLAFSQAPRDPRTLGLLARSLEGVGQPEKAVKVLSELARIAADTGDPAVEADALRRASALAPDDADIRTRLGLAEQNVSRTERRITQLACAEPTSDAETRAVVRAEVFARYGFHDRAEIALREALADAPDSLVLLAHAAELAATRGATDAALRTMARILPRAGADTTAVRDRIVLLGGAPADSTVAVEPPAPAPVAPSAVVSAEARGDALAERGDLPGALLAWREALSENPLNEDVVMKITALRERARAAAAPAPEPPPAPEEADPFADFEALDEGTFSEIDPEALDDVAPAGDIEEARALVAVGVWDAALALIEGMDSLDASVLRAQAHRGMGDNARAVEILRDSTNDADENDPAYCDALFELSALYTATGKHRAAVRLLEEIRDLDPDYRPAEVDARMRGLARLTQ